MVNIPDIVMKEKVLNDRTGGIALLMYNQKTELYIVRLVNSRTGYDEVLFSTRDYVRAIVALGKFDQANN